VKVRHTKRDLINGSLFETQNAFNGMLELMSVAQEQALSCAGICGGSWPGWTRAGEGSVRTKECAQSYL